MNNLLTYGIIGLLVLLAGSLGVNTWQRHELSALKTSSKARIEQLESANAGWVLTLDSVKQSQLQCEQGRVADKEALRKALEENDAQGRTLRQKIAQAKDDLAQEIAGRCSNWASQPSCGLPDIRPLLKGN